MNTFLKVLLFILLGLLAIKFLPFLLLPVLIGGIGVLLMVGLVVVTVLFKFRAASVLAAHP